MKIVFLILFFFLFFLSPFAIREKEKASFKINKPISFSPAAMPLVDPESLPLRLSAKSFLVLDVDSGSLLVSDNENRALAPASLTKVITALVALDSYSLDEVLTVDFAYPVGRNMGLLPGEKIKVYDLLLGLMIHSANDAAYVLAKNHPQGIKGFIKAMNLKAKDLGFVRTHLVNFDGEEDDDHYTTAFELAQLSRFLIKNDFLSQIVQEREVVVSDISGKIQHKLETTNELLGVIPGAKGLKTGWTSQAGECFIGLFEIKDKNGREKTIMTVVLGSNDRFGETSKLVSWVKRNVFWQDYSESHSTETASTKP